MGCPRALPARRVALIAFVVVGCQSTSSTATPMTAPAATATPLATAVARPTPAITPTPVPDGSDVPEDGVFRTVHVLVDGTRPLPIVLEDATGLVVGIEAVPQSLPPFDERVSNPDGQPTVLRYQWIGGACDTLTTITFQRTDGALRLFAETKTTGDACILIGLFRGVDIHLADAVEAKSVIVGRS